MNNDLYYLAFSYFFLIGPVKFQNLLAHFGTAKKIYEGNSKEIASVVGIHLAEKYCRFRAGFDPVKKLVELQKKEIRFIGRESPLYFKELSHIADPPVGLFVKGDIENYSETDICVGIVGTRRPTSYGEQIAKKLAGELSLSGVITVSGMAMGIDGIVHRATLEVGGKTIAILGCGVDVIYPFCNAKLYEDIIKNKGLVVSEFYPGQTPVPGYFILRNRLISGLSKGILVIEGMKDSGTLITARFAAEQGKDVFAVPSQITSSLSEAPHILLKQGAKLATSVDDIIEELGLPAKTIGKSTVGLSHQEALIKDSLQKEPKSVDILSGELEIPVPEILQTLTVMEMKKIVEKNREGKYQLCV